MDAVEKAKSGHPGLPMGAADVATVLFTQFLKFDAAHPKWPDRDRFVLSAGHGSMLLYALLYLTGNADMTLDEIKHFRQLGSRTPGHPENFDTSGVETTTGPLGQGIATSVGMALAEKMLAAEFGKKIVNHHTYVLASDGDLMEGVSQEAIAMAGHWRLNKLIVLYDDNGISIDGPTLACRLGRPGEALQVGRLGGRIDRRPGPASDRGRDRARAEIQQALPDRVQDHDRLWRADQGRHQQGPWRGAGRRRAQGRQGKTWHFAGAVFGTRRCPESLARSGQPWRGRRARNGKRGLPTLSNRKRAEFERRLRHERPAALAKAFRAHKKTLLETPQNVATRKSSESVIEAIAAAMPMEFLAGSADLTGSNNNKAKSAVNFSAKTPKGRFIHYGIREHGMAAAHERHLPAWRVRAERRHLPGVHRLCPAGDAARGADGHRRRLCHDPRFDRSRRRRPDASAGRTSGRAARHSQHARVPSLRRGRSRRVLGTRAQPHRRPDGAGADPPERAAIAHHRANRQPVQPRRL